MSKSDPDSAIFMEDAVEDLEMFIRTLTGFSLEGCS